MNKIIDNASERRAGSTCERILAAAEAEFFNKGYAGARTTSIAAAAGVTHAMLHYYFRTKQHLFETVIAEKVSLMRDLVLSSIGDPEIPLFEKIKSCIGFHLDFMAANPRLPGFMIGEVFRDENLSKIAVEAINAHVAKIIPPLQKQIDDYAGRGECRRVDARMLVIDILSLNVMPFLAATPFNALLNGLPAADPERFIEMRKKENVETILRKLRP